MAGTRARATALALAIAAACETSPHDDRAPATTATDARADVAASGSGGTLSIDSAGPDVRDGAFPSCAPSATLEVENEDGGAWCSCAMPSFPRLILNHIAVQVPTPEGERWLYRVDTAEHCDSDANPPDAPGYYFFESDTVTRIGFCPGACSLIAAEGSGNVRVIQGCAN